jgi:hypothetical protein
MDSEIVPVASEEKLIGELKRFSIVFEDLENGEVGISVKIEPEPTLEEKNVATQAIRMGHFFYTKIADHLQKEEPEVSSQ